MSANFDFLRNFNNDLHYLACVIESEIYDSPSAVLTDATTFLEIIIYEIFKKYDLSTESLPYFKDKVIALSNGGFISRDLSKNLIKAYQKRNKMHSYNGDVKNHLNLNKNRAVQIHRLLFNVSWRYYQEYCEDSFKVAQPSYVHPSRLESDVFGKDNIDDGKCIVCAGKTKTNEIFCSECKYKIEKSDNLKTLRKHFGFNDGFKRNNLIEMGFEKGYVGTFLQELKNEELIYTVGKLNMIDKENTTQYIREAEDMVAVEKMLSDFKMRNIDLNDILNHEFYQLGKNGQYPFVELYRIFSEIFYSKFLSDLNSDKTLKEILDNSSLNDEDLNDWYLKEMKSNTAEFSIFNEKLIDEIFKYKRKRLGIEEIKTKLNITDLILNTIINDKAEIGKLYRQKEDECVFSLFIKEIAKDKITKKEALKNVNLSEKRLDELLMNNPEFQKRYEKSYTVSRMNRFIKFFDYYNYKSSYKKVGLTVDEIDDWLKKGRKMIKYSRENIFSRFLDDFNEVTMKKYIEYREKKNTRKKALKKLNTDSKTITQLFTQNEEYKNELDNVLTRHAISDFKSGMTKDEVIRDLDLKVEWLNTALEKGRNGEEQYAELYQKYSQNAIPSQINEFLELIKVKPLKNVLSQLNMDERELNSWCVKGKSGDELFKDFYDEYLEFKKERYIKTLIKTNSKDKALKKSYLTSDEVKEHENELDELIFEKRISIVTDELEKGNTTKRAGKKASIKIYEIYDWLEKGLNGDEYFKEFAQIYKKEYLMPIEKAYEDGIMEGVTEKNIIRTMKRHDFIVDDDVKYLKRLNLFPKPEDIVIELEDNLDTSDLNE